MSRRGVWPAIGATVAAAVLLPGCRSPRGLVGAQAVPASAGGGIFRDVAKSAGIDFRLGHGDSSGLSILDTIGHGCGFLDYDGDGHPDIALVGDPGARLYRNRGDGTFADVTSRALPAPSAGRHFLGCSVADYDNDGRPDLLLTGYGSLALYHNEGNGTFREVTDGSGLGPHDRTDWMTSAAWADVDGDGLLDLYVCRYVHFGPGAKQLCGFKGLDGSSVKTACGPDEYAALRGSLYKNRGGGRFTEVTAAAGLGDAHGKALGCMFCDFNADGRPDLYVANDTKPADLYRNEGGGRFRNIGVESGTALGADGQNMSGMGVDWGDYDNDGHFDLVVANYAGQPKALFHNDGGILFSNRSYQSGIGAASLRPLSFGAAFVDVDNDGRSDLVFTNGHVQSQVAKIEGTATYPQGSQLFRNLGGGRFQDATAGAGPDFARPIVGRGIAVADFDGDGRQDLLLVDDEGAPLLLRNQSPSGAHWISFRCRLSGAPGDSVGTRVELRAGAQRQVGEVRAGGSYLSANYSDVHFGLGSASQASELSFRWPGGGTSVLRDLPADRRYVMSPKGLLGGR